MLGASDGSLWIGTNRGLAKWKDLDLTVIESTPAFIEAIVQDPQGKIWVTRSQVRDDAGSLCEVAGNSFRCHGSSEGIPFAFAQPLFRDKAGNLWIGSSLGLSRWQPGNVTNFITKSLQKNSMLAGVGAIAEQSDGSLVVGMKRSGPGLGLQRLTQDNKWSDYIVPGMNGTELEVTALLTATAIIRSGSERKIMASIASTMAKPITLRAPTVYRVIPYKISTKIARAISG